MAHPLPVIAEVEMINDYRHLLIAAREYDPLSNDYFLIVNAVSNYNSYLQRWHDSPQSRPELEPLIDQMRAWCEEIQYAITNRRKIPGLRDIEESLKMGSLSS